MTTILRGIVGSTAYGLNHAGSDVDRLGMYVAPTIDFHGLHVPTRKAGTRVTKIPGDCTEHEVGKYLNLLLACNPTVTELLWLPDDLYEVVTPEGLSLIYLRDRFLCAQGVRNAYLGYATQQFRKLKDRGGTFSSDTIHRTEKHARHLKRLCWQGFTLYSEGWLPIRVEGPEAYHEFGRRVSEDPDAASEVIEQYEELFNTTESVLPDIGDEALADNWLRVTRARHYDGDIYAHGKVHYSPSDTERAYNFLINLIDNGLVGYRTPTECLDAVNKMTKVFHEGEHAETT